MPDIFTVTVIAGYLTLTLAALSIPSPRYQQAPQRARRKGAER